MSSIDCIYIFFICLDNSPSRHNTSTTFGNNRVVRKISCHIVTLYSRPAGDGEGHLCQMDENCAVAIPSSRTSAINELSLEGQAGGVIKAINSRCKHLTSVTSRFIITLPNVLLFSSIQRVELMSWAFSHLRHNVTIAKKKTTTRWVWSFYFYPDEWSRVDLITDYVVTIRVCRQESSSSEACKTNIKRCTISEDFIT